MLRRSTTHGWRDTVVVVALGRRPKTTPDPVGDSGRTVRSLCRLTPTLRGSFQGNNRIVIDVVPDDEGKVRRLAFCGETGDEYAAEPVPVGAAGEHPGGVCGGTIGRQSRLSQPVARYLCGDVVQDVLQLVLEQIVQHGWPVGLQVGLQDVGNCGPLGVQGAGW
jgi:hypothetical protein